MYQDIKQQQDMQSEVAVNEEAPEVQMRLRVHGKHTLKWST